jgi:hypothetical protein
LSFDVGNAELIALDDNCSPQIFKRKLPIDWGKGFSDKIYTVKAYAQNEKKDKKYQDAIRFFFAS